MITWLLCNQNSRYCLNPSLEAASQQINARRQAGEAIGLHALQTISDDTFLTVNPHENEETLTAKQRHQTNNPPPPFINECFHMPRLGGRHRAHACLFASPLPYRFTFAYLFAFTYSYLRFGHSFLAS